MARVPGVTFSGPLDLLVERSLAEDVVAVIREALTNVVKHSDAANTSVDVTVDDTVVSVEVVDDGHGMDAATRHSGLANMERRATARQGTFEIRSTGAGTVVRWTVPHAALNEAPTP
jgi:signal transduction histidine kinase